MIKLKDLLKEARLNDIVPDIIFIAAQYTSKKLDHIARQSWDSSEELTKEIMQSIPIHKWTSFRKDVNKLLKTYRIREEIQNLKERVNYIGPFVFSDRTDKEELLDVVAGAVDGYSNYTRGMQYKKSDYKKAYQEAEKILKKVHGMSGNEINREVRKR